MEVEFYFCGRQVAKPKNAHIMRGEGFSED